MEYSWVTLENAVLSKQKVQCKNHHIFFTVSIIQFFSKILEYYYDFKEVQACASLLANKHAQKLLSDPDFGQHIKAQVSCCSN